MIEFFRDVLDGPLYIVVVIVSIFLIMAIIGFMMERKKLEKETKARIAVVEKTNDEVVPIPPVSMMPEVEIASSLATPTVEVTTESNPTEEIPLEEVKPQVIVFEDPDSKEEPDSKKE